MEQTTIQTMPKTIIVDEERRAEDEALRRGLRNAQEAYSCLRQLEDLGEVPEPIKCTPEWAEQICKVKKEAVNKADFLTKEQKLSQIGHWGKFTKKVLGLINTIQTFISTIPQEQYVFDESLNTFYLKDIDSIVTSRCTRTVPDDAIQHWELIRQIDEAVQNLRKWEREKDLKKIPLKELMSMSAKNIAISWATKSITIDHSFDHLPGIKQSREMLMKEII